MTGQGYAFGGEKARRIAARIREIERQRSPPPSPAGGVNAMSAKDEQDMDRLADQVASGRSLALAATRCGISIFRAEALWMRIVNRLGYQAK